MRRWLINVAKNETILIVAAILALISCFIVPPDADYKSYIHASSISQLICLRIPAYRRVPHHRFAIAGEGQHHARTGHYACRFDVLFRDVHHQ